MSLVWTMVIFTGEGSGAMSAADTAMEPTTRKAAIRRKMAREFLRILEPP